MSRYFGSCAALVTFALFAFAEDELKVTLDGKPVTPHIYSLNARPDKAEPEDVIAIGGYRLVLGSERNQNYRSTPHEDGQLLKVSDNKEVVVAVTVNFTFKGNEKVISNPLAKMTSEQIKKLRGVKIQAWNDEIAKSLSLLDLEKTCVTVTDDVALDRREKSSLPALPKGLRYLVIEEWSNTGLRDYSTLKEQNDLRYLLLRVLTVPFDFEHLKQATNLRYIQAFAVGVKNIDSLASLAQLRSAGLYSDGIESLDFVSGMKNLVELDVSRTNIKTLAPLSGLKSLSRVTANSTRVASLPDPASLPSLKRLEVMSTALSDEQVAKFRSALPKCQVLFRWQTALADAAAEATRLRVRTGGTCHRTPETEKTLFEVKDVVQIRRLLGSIRIDEKRSGFECQCCGEPSFEFYAGEKLLLTVGFHHGQGLRWAEGWPGDAALTVESAESICRWMSANGHRGPLEEFERGRVQAAATERRMEFYRNVIPQSVLEKMDGATSRKQFVAAFQEGIADESARATLYLKLFGAGHSSWNRYALLDETLKEVLLPGVKPATLIKMVDSADEVVRDGAARWFFADDRWEKTAEKDRAAIVKALGQHAFSHPRSYNRRLTIDILAKIKGDESVKLLQAMLAGEIKPKALPKEDAIEPDGMFMARPGDLEMTKGSDRAYAGLMLGRLGHAPSLETLRKLLEKAEGDDKILLTKAIDLLVKRP